MISFDNTEIAFRSKSDKDLKRAYRLFKLIGNPFLVKIGKWLTELGLKLHLPIEGMIRKTIFKQFCGGVNINDCSQTIEILDNYSIGTILDYSVEGKTSESDFEGTVNEIIGTIKKAKSQKGIPFAVFKLTGITKFQTLEALNSNPSEISNVQKLDYDNLIYRVDRICNEAFKNQIPIFIDAEETWIQDAIDHITHLMMEKYNQEKAYIYNTVQMYRHDRLDFLNQQISIARQKKYKYGVKLVRGAYMEKERERAVQKGYHSPIQPDKAATDHDFDMALKLCIENIDNVALCAGTHNEESSMLLAKMLKENGIQENDKRIYFAQLLGMSDHISYNLAEYKFNVAKYVPYGPIREVMPYLLRRANENTSVAGQTGRELTLISRERLRRNSK